MNTNIRTVQSESSAFASLLFDYRCSQKHPTTAPSSQSERHLTVFYMNPNVVYFLNCNGIKMLKTKYIQDLGSLLKLTLEATTLMQCCIWKMDETAP